jgi:hypothetical protein
MIEILLREIVDEALVFEIHSVVVRAVGLTRGDRNGVRRTPLLVTERMVELAEIWALLG